MRCPRRGSFVVGPSCGRGTSRKLVSGAFASIVVNESSHYDVAGILVGALIADIFMLNGRQ